MQPVRTTPLRAIIFFVAGIECAAWLPFLLDFLFASGSHEAKFFSQMLAREATTIFVLSAVPALVLAYLGRWLWLAAIFAFWPIPVVGYIFAVIAR